MQYSTVAQLVRIAAYTVASFLLGQAIADGEVVQAAITGLVNLGAFGWWFVTERNKPADPA